MNIINQMNPPHRRAAIAFAIKMLCLVAILSASTLLQAQSFYGTIVGTVTDSSGAVVPSATVKITNVGTGTSQTVTSEASGRFSVVNLVPGAYNVEVSKATFKRFVREGAVVEVGATTRVDAALQVGGVNETVEVTTNAPLLETDSAQLGQEIEGAQVQEEPLNGRNVMNLIALAPGVVPTGGAMGGTGLNQGTRTAGGAGWGDYQIGGAIQGQSGNYIDGVANNLLGGNPIGLVPTQDAIQEFNVASSNAGADFGRYSGGVVNMTTKSGTNAWHGSVWEYNRNRDYNANNFFNNESGAPRPVWNQNQYGASASGPILKDKAFFMFTWEGFKALTGNLTPTNVPTLAMQNGVFTNAITDPGYLNSNGTSTGPICNVQPYTGQTINGMTFPSGGYYITNLYVPNGGLNPYNGQPTTCGDPTNEVMKQFYPLPNANPATNGGSNWYLTTPLGNHQEQYNARMDYTLSAKQRLFARYTYWAPIDQPHTEFNDTGYKNGTSGNGTTWPTDDGQAAYYTTQAVVGDTVTLNATSVLDVRLNYVRQYAPNLAQSTNVNEAQFGTNYAALASQMSVHIQPAFNPSGGLHNLYNMGNYPNDGITWYNTYGLSAALTKIVGAHSLKIGAEIRLMDYSGVSYNGGGSGSYSYNTNFAGDEWANFLMGYSTGATFKTDANTASYTYYQGYYITDTWQAGRNLTINAGLRYELPGAVGERNNKDVVLLPNAPVTAITSGPAVNGTLALVAGPQYGDRTTVVPEYNLFAPNLGFAYRASDTTVIRGGYGISYLPNDLLGGVLASSAYVNSVTTAQNVTTATPVPLQTLLSTIVGTGITQPFGRNNPNFMTRLVSNTSFLNQNISGPVPFQPFPWTQHWSAALSHEFNGNMMAEVSYSGLKGINLPEEGNRNLNQLADSYDSLGAGLATKQACAAANNISMSVGQCDRTYPYYGNVSDTAGLYAIENYRAFMGKLEKRMGAAGVITANYTRAKNMGNTDTQASYLENKATTQGGSGNGAIQDYTNLAGEYSLISYDVTNRGIVSYVLSLPFGKGQKYGNSYSETLNSFISGWTLNGVTTFQSGFPVFLAVSGGSQLPNYGAGTIRPIVVPGCNKVIGGSGLARAQAGAWFNPNCFETVGATTTINGAAVTNIIPFSAYQFGTEPRVDPTIRGDGVKNFDVSIGKSTTIHEKASLAFRVEFFNIMNRVQFAPPIPTVGGADYAGVTYQVNQPRQLQMSLRFNY